MNKITHDAPRKACGVGYVVLSVEQDRDNYVSSSFRNNRLTIVTEDNEVIKNCFVAKNVWQSIVFPDDAKGRGSAVLWVNVPHQNKVVIMDTIVKKDELNSIQTEHQFKMERLVEDKVVTISGDGYNGRLTIVTKGNGGGEGEVYMRVLNSDEVGLFNVYVQGTIAFEAERELNFRAGRAATTIIRDDANDGKFGKISYVLGDGFVLLDEFNQTIKTNKAGITAIADTISLHGEGKDVEPTLLGNKSQVTFNDLHKALKQISTALKTATPIGAPVVLAPPIQLMLPTLDLLLVKIAEEIKTIKTENVKVS